MRSFENVNIDYPLQTATYVHSSIILDRSICYAAKITHVKETYLIQK